MSYLVKCCLATAEELRCLAGKSPFNYYSHCLEINLKKWALFLPNATSYLSLNHCSRGGFVTSGSSFLCLHVRSSRRSPPCLCLLCSEAVHRSSSAWRRWSDEALGGAPSKGGGPRPSSVPGREGVAVADCQVTHRSQLIKRDGEKLAQTPTGTGLRLQLVSEDVQLTGNPELHILCGLFSTISTFHINIELLRIILV